MCQQHTTVPDAEKFASQRKQPQRTAQKKNAENATGKALSSVFSDRIKSAQSAKVPVLYNDILYHRRLLNLLKAE
ncbi:hypothetical protein IKE88_02190 [Candidatus Saccharibacteria bacterium]|nr:hypothetical protein [Candidatus Saccharibacteria bacterium]MBR2864334.1 hypothetical protein [Candidatus Saccharibacteria bacterium]